MSVKAKLEKGAVTAWLARLFRRLACLTGHHEWTCKAAEGIPPTEQEVRDGIDGYERYGEGFCRNCGRGYPWK